MRTFDKVQLDSAALADILAFIDATKPLDGQSARFEIINANKIKNASAPHYILAHCAASSSSYANVGYMLQNADLYLQSNGYGSLWLGVAKPIEQDEDYCIMLAFGKTNVPMRQNLQDFKRLPISEISSTDNGAAQAARLAPSAMNSQPWKLEFSNGKITIRSFGRGMTKLILKKKLNKIDLGIVTRHVEVALLNEGKEIQAITAISDSKNFGIEVAYQ